MFPPVSLNRTNFKLLPAVVENVEVKFILFGVDVPLPPPIVPNCKFPLYLPFPLTSSLNPASVGEFAIVTFPLLNTANLSVPSVEIATLVFAKIFVGSAFTVKFPLTV